MPQLTALDVRDCDRITNLTLRAVVRYLPRLRSLNLEHCTKVSAAAPACFSTGWLLDINCHLYETRSNVSACS